MLAAITRKLEKTGLSVKTQTLAALAAILGAVALPQLVHITGKMFGVGTSFGEMLLPMHLPIILVGFFAGPYAGLLAGVFGPLCSFALSGMPTGVMLPFILIEVGLYGLSAGMVRKGRMPIFGKLLLVQLTGRAGRALATLFAFYVIGSTKVGPKTIWTSVLAGSIGIILQWILMPAIFYGVRRRSNES